MSKMIEWGSDKLNFLRENYESMTYEEMAGVLGISTTAVHNKCYSMGLLRKRGGINPRVHVWTEEETAYLVANFADEAGTDIADYLGVSVPTVQRKARELGLKKSPMFSKMKYNGRYVKNYKHNGKEEKA